MLEPAPLYDLCSKRTARLLKNSYWDAELPLCQNPFSFLPSSIINRLIVYVDQITKEDNEPLLSSNLQLLLTSGRVTEFRLQYAKLLNAEDLGRIVIHLLTSCRCLTAIIINSVDEADEKNTPFLTDAMNCLLRETRNIKHIETWIKFDFRALCDCVKLETVVINFLYERHIQDLLKIDAVLRPRSFLKHIVINKGDLTISYLDTAILLKYCKELVFVNWDISEALEYLHAEELHNGSLTHTYKIQQCCLGSPCYKAAARDAVIIASLTCPYLKDIDISINDDDVISALSGCQNLSTLRISCKPPLSGKYHKLRSLLEKAEIGHNLKNLSLLFFTAVDFSSIDMCCPNLEVLNVFYYSEDTRGEYSPTSFRKLQTLHLKKSDHKKNAFIGILRNATNLRKLAVRFAEEFTDDVLDNILQKNSLSNLKYIKVTRCGLSLHGWRKLARLTALEQLKVFGNENSEEIASVVHEINPKVNVFW